jgi:hypothetical protein
MKKLALATAGIFLLAPAPADASQPTQPAETPPATTAAPAAPAQKPDEPVTGQPSVPPAKPGAQTDTTCLSPGKSSNNDAKAAHPSAKVGKDTGELPAPRKKPPSDACASQPD